jgi:SAM-dependent methyltransferase
VYGDGLGFDSAFLATIGFNVTSLEPSERGQRFAAEVFEKNDVTVRQVAGDDSLAGETFDAIVCLDVLEHLPSPPHTLDHFHRWLAPHGLLVVSAPFFLVDRHRPTHLAANRKYSGSLALFRSAGFEPLAGRWMWDPVAFRKGLGGTFRATLPLRIGQPLLATGRRLGPIHSRLARWMLRTDTALLQQLQAPPSGGV